MTFETWFNYFSRAPKCTAWKEKKKTKSVTFSQIIIFYTLRPLLLMVLWRTKPETQWKSASPNQRESYGRRCSMLWHQILALLSCHHRIGLLRWSHGWSHPWTHVFGSRRPRSSHQIWSPSTSYPCRYSALAYAYSSPLFYFLLSELWLIIVTFFCCS